MFAVFYPTRYIRRFTLIDLMISLVIAGVLTSVALPSYRQYMLHSNRCAAQNAMLEIAHRQQQILLAQRAYADTDQLRASGYALPPEVGRHYTLNVRVDIIPVPTFVITLTGIGTQSRDGPLTLDNYGIKSPAAKWQG